MEPPKKWDNAFIRVKMGIFHKRPGFRIDLNQEMEYKNKIACFKAYSKDIFCIFALTKRKYNNSFRMAEAQKLRRL